jgi:hypothetical protein
VASRLIRPTVGPQDLPRTSWPSNLRASPLKGYILPFMEACCRLWTYTGVYGCCMLPSMVVPRVEKTVRATPARVTGGGGVNKGPLGPRLLGLFGSSNTHHRRTLELILQEGSAFFKHQIQGPRGPVPCITEGRSARRNFGTPI